MRKEFKEQDYSSKDPLTILTLFAVLDNGYYFNILEDTLYYFMRDGEIYLYDSVDETIVLANNTVKWFSDKLKEGNYRICYQDYWFYNINSPGVLCECSLIDVINGVTKVYDIIISYDEDEQIFKSSTRGYYQVKPLTRTEALQLVL